MEYEKYKPCMLPFFPNCIHNIEYRVIYQRKYGKTVEEST